jgi:hypothetical protein
MLRKCDDIRNEGTSYHGKYTFQYCEGGLAANADEAQSVGFG